MFLKNKNRFTVIQTIVIIFIWVLLLAVPVLFGDFPENRRWVQIFRIWKEYVFLFILFLINRFILLPLLFFKGRRIIYFISVGVLILLLFMGMFLNHKNNQQNKPSLAEEPMMRPPLNERLRPPLPLRRDPLVPPYANHLILSFLILGFDTGLNISMKWIQSEQNRIRLERESSENKLAFLQNQVSPHFFMNTLNNIHALVDINTDEAKESIIKLSRLMGYLLYESQVEKISFFKEIQFINSYVELMRLRFSEKVKINIKIPEELPNVNIPPLLFISFIENAFKHGISYENDSFVEILFSFEDGSLQFKSINSNHNRPMDSENSGIGLNNIRKRLDLLYGSNYTLKIAETKEIFKVKLDIPI